MQTAGIPVSLYSRFHCSLERAHQAPILGDATRYLSGYRFQPPIIGFEEDQTWGQIGGIRYLLSPGNWCFRPGRMLTDRVLERQDNRVWVWEISEFQSNALFFLERAIGRWETTAVDANSVDVRFSYRYIPRNRVFLPLVYGLVQVQVRGMLEQALIRIREYAESTLPMVYQVPAMDNAS